MVRMAFQAMGVPSKACYSTHPETDQPASPHNDACHVWLDWLALHPDDVEEQRWWPVHVLAVSEHMMSNDVNNVWVGLGLVMIFYSITYTFP